MGYLLLLCHWLSAVICSWIVWILVKDSRISDGATPRNAALSTPVAQSIDAILQVGGYVILYSVLAGILKKFLLPLPTIPLFLHAALEMSGGIYAVCQSSLSMRVKGIVLSAALGFSGLSILSQNHYMLKSIGVQMHKLILFGALRAFLSGLIMVFLLMLLPIK